MTDEQKLLALRFGKHLDSCRWRMNHADTYLSVDLGENFIACDPNDAMAAVWFYAIVGHAALACGPDCETLDLLLAFLRKETGR